MSFATILWQTTPTWPCPQHLRAHRPFDLVQAAEKPRREHVMPHPPSAIGAVVRLKARPHPWRHFLLNQGVLAWWAGEPSVESRSRDAQRRALLGHRPDPPMGSDEDKSYIAFLAKYAAAFFRSPSSAWSIHAIAGIGPHNTGRDAVGLCCTDLRERDLRLGGEAQFLWHACLVAPRRIASPNLWQVQPPGWPACWQPRG